MPGGAIPGGGPALLVNPGGAVSPGGPSLCLASKPGGGGVLRARGGVLRARGGVLCPLLIGGPPPSGGNSFMFTTGLSHRLPEIEID